MHLATLRTHTWGIHPFGSFRHSPWDAFENLPVEYSRIFDFENFARTQRRVMQESAEFPVSPFDYVAITVEGVPLSFLEERRALDDLPVTPVLSLYGLHRHERKLSVLNFALTRHSASGDHHIANKDDVVIVCGPRRITGRPVFSDDGGGDKHRMRRFLQPAFSGSVVASVIAPVTYLPAPALFFHDQGPGRVPILLATGSLREVNPRRVVVKRIVLTGQPFKVHRNTATVRYMFYTPEDVRWFKPVQVCTDWWWWDMLYRIACVCVCVCEGDFSRLLLLGAFAGVPNCVPYVTSY